VNDLVKHFSDLMLAASVAFGVQKAIIAIGSYWLISAALTIAAVAWGFVYWRRRNVWPWLSKLLVVLLMVRFAVPVVVIGTDVIWHKFLSADYVATQAAIDSASGQAQKLGPPVVAGAESSLLEKARQWVSGVTDVKARFDDIKLAAERVTEQIIRLMVIFLLQTLILPVLLLWGLYAIVRGLFGQLGRPGYQRVLAPSLLSNQ
jgi:hypothetical protein